MQGHDDNQQTAEVEAFCRSASVPDPTAKATPAASGLPRGNAGAQTAAAAAPSNLGQSVQSKETPANTPQVSYLSIQA